MFWLVASAVDVVVGALLQSLTEGQCDGHSPVSHLGRSASVDISPGVKLVLERCWQKVVAPTLTVWTEAWTEVFSSEVWTSEVEAEVRGREVWE